MMHENATPASQLGGAAFQALVEASCRADPAKDKKLDRIIFGGDFDLYDRCTKGYEYTP